MTPVKSSLDSWVTLVKFIKLREDPEIGWGEKLVEPYEPSILFSRNG